MQFEYTPPQTALETAMGGHFDVNAFGSINPGDDVTFEEFLQRSSVPPRASIFIDSGGGDVETAINIGHLIRDCWFSTHIGRVVLGAPAVEGLIFKREFFPGSCMSAATLMFLGGKLRYYSKGSRFGVHQFSFKDPTPEHIGRSQILSSRIARYAASMGVQLSFLEVSSSISATNIELLDARRLEEFGVITGGQTPVNWSMVARCNSIAARGERDSMYGHHKILLSYMGGEFVLHAFIEPQGREEMLENFPIVELVLNDESIKIDIAERAIRATINSYTNVICKLTKEEARQIALSDGVGIQIRGSADAEMFLGIAPMSTVGGKEMLTSFYTAVTGDMLVPFEPLHE